MAILLLDIEAVTSHMAIFGAVGRRHFGWRRGGGGSVEGGNSRRRRKKREKRGAKWKRREDTGADSGGEERGSCGRCAFSGQRALWTRRGAPVAGQRAGCFRRAGDGSGGDSPSLLLSLSLSGGY